MNRTMAAVVVVLVLAACGAADETSVASNTPSPPASAQTEPAAASQSASASPIPSADEPPAQASDWSRSATFGDAGTVTQVTDVTAWEGGFAAVGHHWPAGYVGSPDSESRLWTSSDGRTWEQSEANFGTTDLEFRGIGRLANGGLVAIGEIGRWSGDLRAIRAAVWTSPDGLTWTEHELPFGEGAAGIGFAAGPLGYVATDRRELWHSGDGIEWTMVYEVAEDGYLAAPSAGDEGFVVAGYRDSGSSAFVLASGDGITWYESGHAGFQAAAPLGGDWLQWASTPDAPTISILRSANGLDWAPVLDVNTLTPSDGPKSGLGMASGITEANVLGEGGVAVLTLAWNHCCVALAMGLGVWTSSDGTSWVPALGEGAYVTTMATNGDVTVLGGYLGRGSEAAFWVADR